MNLTGQKKQILDMLSEAGDEGVTNRDLNLVAFRYSARIDDLKKKGFDIRSKRVKGSLWRFILVRPVLVTPQAPKPPPGKPTGPAQQSLFEITHFGEATLYAPKEQT